MSALNAENHSFRPSLERHPVQLRTTRDRACASNGQFVTIGLEVEAAR